MPRMSREKSYTKIYHIMIRGINKEKIFLDKEDNYKFKKDLKLAKERYQFDLYAYCIMPNHVHLVIKDCKNCLENIMKSVNIRYSAYFNKKYERVGHLFQNRFLSKKVETDDYLMTLHRYIHQNPEKANIARTDEYKWSSYKDYIYHNGLADTDFILNMFSDDKWYALEEFKKYNLEHYREKENEVLEYEFKARLSDEELIKVIQDRFGVKVREDINIYNNEYRNELLKKIKMINGTSLTQIGRVLGINRKIVERAK